MGYPIPKQRPRALIGAAELDEVRTRIRSGHDQELGRLLEVRATEVRSEAHSMAEPPFLADRARHPDRYFPVWRQAMYDSRSFLEGALTLAMAGALLGRPEDQQAALHRLASVCAWDPDGSTSIAHNDEPHMSIIDWGTRVYDLCIDVATADQAEAITRGLSARAERTYRWLYDSGYGHHHTSSHSGRMTGFLGELAIVLHHEVDEAVLWLDYVLGLFDRGYPFMGRPDGGWLEGVLYSTAYVSRLCHLTWALRRLGIRDVYAEPFLANHPAWRRAFVWPGAPRLPFGDGQDNAHTAAGSVALEEHLTRVTGSAAHRRHADALRRVWGERAQQRLVSPLVLFVPPESPDVPPEPEPAVRHFPDVGWLSITPTGPRKRGLRLLARCAPTGTTSHQHGDQGGFALYAGTEAVLVPTGVYGAYGSAHHHRWMRSSRGHNCITLDGAGQIVRDPEATGEFLFVRNEGELIWARGDVSAAYGDRVQRYIRDFVVWSDCLVLVRDRITCGRGEVMPTLHLHSFLPMKGASEAGEFSVETGEGAVRGRTVTAAAIRSDVWQGYDPPPTVEDKQYAEPFNLDIAVDRCTARHDMVTALWWPDVAMETLEMGDDGVFHLAGERDGDAVEVTWDSEALRLGHAGRSWPDA